VPLLPEAAWTGHDSALALYAVTADLTTMLYRARPRGAHRRHRRAAPVNDAGFRLINQYFS
jgi:hypothetical protein